MEIDKAASKSLNDGLSLALLLVDLPDAVRRPYVLGLNLKLRGNQLMNGEITARAIDRYTAQEAAAGVLSNNSINKTLVTLSQLAQIENLALTAVRDAAELGRRSVARPERPSRGYARLYRDEILEADRGCDFDFLRKSPTRT